MTDSSIIGQLYQRKMFRIGAGYLAVAWLLWQVVASTCPTLECSIGFSRTILWLLLGGFPVTLAVAWVNWKTAIIVGVAFIAGAGVAVMVTGAQPIPVVPIVEEESTVLPNSVAVLPLSNLSPDANDAYFAAGLHEEILGQLASLSNLKVISRTSVLRYTDSELSIPEIAEELNVGTIMEGSVRYANGQVRITTQLIDASTDEHLWSETYEREFTDIFAIESDIAMNVANAMRVAFSLEEQAEIEQTATDSVEAYAKMLQITNLLPPGNLENIRRMVALADEAIALDPNYARAYGERALLTTDLIQRGEENPEELELLTREYVEFCLVIDPEEQRCHRALGAIAFSHSDWAEARARSERAVQSSENLPSQARSDLSRILLTFGEVEQAVSLSQTNVETHPGNFNALDRYGGALLSAGRFDELLETRKTLVTLYPDRNDFRVDLALSLALSGDPAQAQRELRTAELLQEESLPSNFDYEYLAYVYSKIPSSEDAQRIITNYPESDPSASDELWISLAQGDQESVNYWLRALIQPGASLGDLSSWRYAHVWEPLVDAELVEELYAELGL